MSRPRDVLPGLARAMQRWRDLEADPVVRAYLEAMRLTPEPPPAPSGGSTEHTNTPTQEQR